MLHTREQLKAGWRMFPDDLTDGGFLGYMTKIDPTSKMALLHAVAGQNTSVRNGKITIRDYGSERIGADSAVTTTPIRFQDTFYKRDGTAPEIRTYGTVVEWKHPDVSAWDTLETGFTNNQVFGGAALNVNADGTSFYYFCNATEALYRWNGSYGRLSSTTATTIVLEGTTTLANLGFASSSSIVIDGIDYAYTSISGQTFSGVTPDPTAGGHTVREPVTQVPATVSGAPRGNILFVRDGALFIANIQYNSAGTFAPRPSEIHRSQVGTPTNWTVAGSAGDPKRQEFPEGGGPILMVVQDEQAIYILKSQCVVVWTISDTDTFATGLLKAFDGKSPSTGVIARGACWTGKNGVYFVNRSREVVRISRLAGLDTPQAIPISDPIQPTLDAAVFDDAVGITYKGLSLLAAQKDVDSSLNDAVFVFDERTEQWDTPIVGWNVNSWNVINDELHWGSSSVPVSWRTIAQKVDNQLGFTATYRTHQESFGLPHIQKKADMAYVEGYLAENTVLTISLLFDENGFTQIYERTIRGTDTGYIFFAPPYNPFGANEFGQEQFGSNVAVNDLRKFRVYFPFSSNIEFFTVSFDYAVSAAGQNFEIIRHGIRIVDTLPEARILMKNPA